MAGLWQETLQRAAIPAAKRHPVHIIVDEVQDYLHLPTDLSDALAQARGLGVGFTLAHQYLSQLPKDTQAAVLANARSRVCFHQSTDDAPIFAKGHPELQPADFTALGAYQVYVSMHDHRAESNASRYVFGRTLPLGEPATTSHEMHERSRKRWGRPLSDIEAAFAELVEGNDRTSGQAVGRRRITKSSNTGTASEDPGGQV
ncbi:TraM recognition domain-containing protein [Nakamurella multipartita]|uniref:TraM recognition domain-containing protein n=1 Tax=Nakamurella multipartita TaxID=53461 RepID=UPI00019E8B93|nr:type IV secretory system conjugative DNA transfer family protein [Nakamurella multipartita]